MGQTKASLGICSTTVCLAHLYSHSAVDMAQVTRGQLFRTILEGRALCAALSNVTSMLREAGLCSQVFHKEQFIDKGLMQGA